VPPTVVTGEVSPVTLLLLTVNVPFPFTEFVTTVMDPVAGAVVKFQK
jgi:hypothetical protein